MNKNIENIKIENARIVFRNFSGKPTKYNSKGGVLSFAVVIEDHDFAEQIKAEGWNIKRFKPKDEEDNPDYYLPVKVRYDNYPPHIYLCSNRHKTLLNEETVGSLDYADISGVDVIITPNVYDDINGRSGISAYVKTMYVNVIVDEFAAKYEYDEREEEF